MRPIINSTDKQLRIETLQPYFVQGRIRLHTSQQTLIDQLRHFPKADHDDGPDALEMLWRLAVGGFVSLRMRSSGCRVKARGACGPARTTILIASIPTGDGRNDF